MRFISTRTHAALDYLTGGLLILAPWLFGFASNAPATWVAILFGVGLIAYSLFTDYELAASRQLPMNVHLALDAASGVFLLVSPWLLGFASVVAWPHVVIGLLEIGSALTTRRTPSDEHLAAPSAT
jgi:SPW repeat